MSRNAILCGLMLAIIGGFGYMDAVPETETGKRPMTALIPLWFGLILMICGLVVAFKDNLRKHVMHVAALVGLIGFVGGFMPMYRQTMVKNLPLDISAPAVRSGLMMSAICLLFVGLCIHSFIEARKAREAKASVGA